MTDRSWVQTPTKETIFQAPFIWIKSLKQKVSGMLRPTWHCCMCCNPANGRVDFEDGQLIKSSFITKDEHEAFHLTRTKAQPKKIVANEHPSNIKQKICVPPYSSCVTLIYLTVQMKK